MRIKFYVLEMQQDYIVYNFKIIVFCPLGTMAAAGMAVSVTGSKVK
jgi:hypothetical protein